MILGAKIHVKYLIDWTAESLGEDVFIVTAPDVVSKTFTLTDTPIAQSEFVILNGILTTKGGSYDYTVSGDQIIFTAGVTLTVGDKVHVKYKYM